MPGETQEPYVIAGKLLLNFANDQGRYLFGKQDLDRIDQAFTHDKGSAEFDKFIIQAIKAALNQRRKKFELAQIILERIKNRKLFQDDSEVLILALKDSNDSLKEDDFEGRVGLVEMMRSLVDLGADVNYQDEAGLTALFYCCQFGLPKTYKLLVDSGANVYFKYELPWDSQTGHTLLETQDKWTERKRLNLLQVALNFWLHYSNIGQFYSAHLDRWWGPVVLDLTARGMKVDASDKALLRFFYVAIFQGDTETVRTLLDFGVSLDGVAGRIDNREPYIGSALQAAASGGREEIVKLLLAHGADPTGLAPYGRTVADHKVDTLTPISAIAAAFNMHLGPTVTLNDRVSACMLIVEANKDQSDGTILLQKCIAVRDMALIRRLLGNGYRVDKFPNIDDWQDVKEDDLELVELLESFKISIDYEVLQVRTASKGQLRLLWCFWNAGGPQIPHNKLYLAVKHAVRPGNLEMLRFLVLEYGVNVNEVFPANDYNQPGYEIPKTNLLRAAASSGSAGALEFLLQHGADVTCPGLKEPILEYVRNNVELGPQHVHVVRILALWQNNASANSNNLSIRLRTLLPIEKTARTDISSMNEPEKTPHRSFFGHTLLPGTVDSDKIKRTEQASKEQVYQPLQGLKPIRLVTLQPAGSSDRKIHCQMHIIELEEAGQFEALSYCVDAEKTMPIILNGNLWTISEQLWQALLRLRLPSRTRCLWVEELCVDPNSDQDRTEQRSLTQDIFSAAEQTICWIGESTHDSDDLFDFVMGMETEPSESWKDSWQDGYSCFNLRPKLIGEKRKAFADLTNRPYFWSTWPLVQYTWSKKPMLMSGSRIADWEKFDHAVDCHMRYGARVFWQSLYGVSELLLWSNLAGLRRCKELRSVYAVLALTSSGDARDRVFAMLCLVPSKNFEIDYSASTEFIYRKFTEEVISQEDNLEFLHWSGFCKKGRAQLPSWVPDYSISKPGGILPRCFNPFPDQRSFEVKGIPEFKFEKSKLYAKGKRIDFISVVGQEMPATRDFVVGTNGWKCLVRSWEDCAVKGLSATAKVDGAINSFLQALVACQRRFGDIAWYLSHLNGALSKYDIRTLNDHDDESALYEWQGGAEYKLPNLAYQKFKIENVCPGRRFVVLANGEMGLAHPDVKEGDLVVFLAGTLYPVILRHKNDSDAFELVGDCYVEGYEEVKSSFWENTPLEQFILV